MSTQRCGKFQGKASFLVDQIGVDGRELNQFQLEAIAGILLEINTIRTKMKIEATIASTLYVVCVTEWIGRKSTGWAATNVNGDPTTEVYISDNISDVLTISVNSPENDFAWYVCRGAELITISKEELCRKWLMNEANKAHALQVVLLDEIMKNTRKFM